MMNITAGLPYSPKYNAAESETKSHRDSEEGGSLKIIKRELRGHER